MGVWKFPTQVCFVLFATFALAALQNITVDDAVLVGPVIPAYLPSTSDWNIGNNCSACEVHPNASLAYNGTWHDCTFVPSSGYTQSIEFTFVGSGLYIFFILANTVSTDFNTITYVQFVLDGVDTSTFSHIPTTSTNFEYNQAVYANSNIPFGQHTMTVLPVDDSEDDVLILFDYLIYTTTDDTTTSTAIGGPASSQSPSPTSSGSATTSSGSNTGAIAGGIIGGITVLILVVIASILCFRRYKRGTAQRQRSPLPTAAVAEPFVFSNESTQGVLRPNRRMPLGTEVDGQPPSHNQPRDSASSGTTPPLNPALDSNRSSTVLPLGAAANILEQVEILRDEVHRLRRLHTNSHPDMGWDASGVGSELPPQYASRSNTVHLR